MIPRRNLGAKGPEVAAMGLGCMGMSEFYGKADEAECLATLDRALELGCNFWDTADMYGPYTNEELVGKALRGRREKVFVATKFGIVRGQEPGQRSINGKPEYVKAACEASLKRLGVNQIDLYYLHRVDPDVAIEDTVGAMAALVREGKVRYIGLSEANPETLRKARKVFQITALQSEYSLWSREPDQDVLATCRELGIGFVAYSPLGRGFLTGRFKTESDFPEDDYRRHSPRFQGDNFRRNLELVKVVETMAGRKGCTPSQLALAWVLSRGQDVVPIPGTKHLRFLEENLGALEVRLDEHDLAELEAAFPLGAAAGERYPRQMMSAVSR